MEKNRTKTDVELIRRWRDQLHDYLCDDIILTLDENQIAILRRLWLICLNKHPMATFARRLSGVKTENVDDLLFHGIIEKVAGYLVSDQDVQSYWAGIADAFATTKKDAPVSSMRKLMELKLLLLYGFVTNRVGFSEITSMDLSELLKMPSDTIQDVIAFIYSYLDGNEGDLPFPWLYRLKGFEQDHDDE